MIYTLTAQPFIEASTRDEVRSRIPLKITVRPQWVESTMYCMVEVVSRHVPYS